MDFFWILEYNDVCDSINLLKNLSLIIKNYAIEVVT